MQIQDKLVNLSPRPKIAVHKFSSCDGCQLALINDAVSLLELNKIVDIIHFAEIGPLDDATPVDLSIIEGSISTKHDIERINTIRSQAKYLIAVGACAVSGGVQALRNFTDGRQLLKWQHDVYPEETESIISQDLPTAKPIRDYVAVDHEISGCPINTGQILHAIRQVLFGVEPEVEKNPVCITCKASGVACVIVAKNEPCLGPVVADGCGALCPKLGRGCYGCYGPSKHANIKAMTNNLREMGLNNLQIRHKYHHINSQSDTFLQAGEKL
jgi:sulfhydrogenase subunit delta